MRRGVLVGWLVVALGVPGAGAQEQPCEPAAEEAPPEGFWRLALAEGPNVANDVALDPAAPTRVAVAASPVGPMAGGAFVSADDGATWSRGRGIPSDLRTWSVAFSPADPGVLYAATDTVFLGEDEASVFRSIDGGAVWCPVGWFGTSAEILLTDERVPGVVWAGLSDGRVMRSDDQGLSWTGGTGIAGGKAVRALAAGPSPDELLAVASEGVFRSQDGGRTWSRSETGIERTLTGTSPAGYDLALDPRDASTVFAAVGTGIHRSKDFGKTWTRIPLAVTNVRDHTGGGCYALALSFVAFAVTASGTMVGGSSCGLWVSRDDGVTWTHLSEFPGSGASFSVVRARGFDVWAGTPAEGVYRSRDDAISFDVAPPGWADGSPGILGPLGDGHWLGQSEWRSLRSADGGRTWRAVDDFHEAILTDVDPDPRHGNVVVVTTGTEGFFRSTDWGVSWTPVAVLPRAGGRVAADPFRSGGFWAATPAGLWRSADGGATWLPRGVVPAATVAAFEASPHSEGVLFAGGTGTLFRSADGGVTWIRAEGISPVNETSSGAATVTAVGFAPGQPDVVLAGASALYRSIDGGRTFQKVAGLPPAVRPTRFAGQPALPGVVWMSASKGLFRSADGGITWVPADESGLEWAPGTRLVYADPDDPSGFAVLAGPHAMWPFKGREALPAA